MAVQTDGLSGAQIEAICRGATVMAIRDVLDVEPDARRSKAVCVTAEQFQHAIDDVRRSALP